MDENNNIKENVKMKIAIYNIEKEINETKKSSIKITKSLVAACFCIIFTSSIVFAKDIENFIKDKFKIGNGVQSAVESGKLEVLDSEYNTSKITVVSPENEFLESNLGIKVNSFYVDYEHISIEFVAKYDEKLKKIFDFENINIVDIDDLSVKDDKKTYFSYNNDDEKYNTGLNTFIDVNNISDNTVSFIYNIYVLNDEFPKIENLKINFNSINFSDNNKKIINLKGKWNVNLDVPDKMYEMSDSEYYVVSNSNDNIEVYRAKSTDIGFEFACKIYGLEKPVLVKEIDEIEHGFEQWKTENMDNYMQEVDYIGEKVSIPIFTEDDRIKYFKSSELREIYEEYYKKLYPISNDNQKNILTWIEKTEGNYIKNEKNEKFYTEESVSLYSKWINSFDENGVFVRSERFEMMPKNLSDIITVVIEVNRIPYEIVLRKK